ncbi:MAG TPA: transcription elongation factor GreA [Candidatus Paceibacterota bacterium]|jgi:transcription elongation factor GreA|nr:transcription elongation factor GreA [Candidatus Paceibacterota bacterium]HRV32422.1 transcription elongation factor GreA [Candidatus Paceibacterota bacterium]
MIKAKYSLTKEALEKLKAELDNLKVQRKEAIARIKVAKGYGDLSENSEYEEARENQGVIETRIMELEEIIRNANVIQVANRTNKIVVLGSTVDLKLVDKPTDDIKTVQIVTSIEASPATGKISQDSPLGKALLNKQVGDIVIVQTPKKDIKYQIVKIY